MQQEAREWEFYMHKVNDGSSYRDFREKLHPEKGKSGAARPSDDDLRAIIESSRNVARMH